MKYPEDVRDFYLYVDYCNETDDGRHVGIPCLYCRKKPPKKVPKQNFVGCCAQISNNELWGMLLYSMRYAFGRRSYAVGEVCDWIRAYQQLLTTERLEQIAREVNEELEREEKQNRFLGDECDHRTWMTLVADLRRSVQTRRSEG